jgi:hypothetical protein
MKQVYTIKETAAYMDITEVEVLLLIQDEALPYCEIYDPYKPLFLIDDLNSFVKRKRDRVYKEKTPVLVYSGDPDISIGGLNYPKLK